MNDQQLMDALRGLGSRRVEPDLAFRERLWDHLEGRRAWRRSAVRREFLLAATLVLLLTAVLIAVGAGLFREVPAPVFATTEPTRTGVPTASPTPTPQPSLDMAALLGPWRPTPIPVPDEFVLAVEVACRDQWFRSEELFGREHRGGEFLVALLDARGEGRATLGFRASDGRVNFCGVEFKDRGGFETVSMASSGEPALGNPRVVAPTEMVHGMSWSDREGTPGNWTHASGPYGQAGDQITAAVIDGPDRPTVTASVANGLWTYWVPWVWDNGPSTVTGFDAEGRPITTLRWP